MGQLPACKGERRRQGCDLLSVVMRLQAGRGRTSLSLSGCFRLTVLLSQRRPGSVTSGEGP